MSLAMSTLTFTKIETVNQSIGEYLYNTLFSSPYGYEMSQIKLLCYLVLTIVWFKYFENCHIFVCMFFLYFIYHQSYICCMYQPLGGSSNCGFEPQNSVNHFNKIIPSNDRGGNERKKTKPIKQFLKCKISSASASYICLQHNTCTTNRCQLNY